MKSLQIGLRWTSKVAGGAERVYADLAAALPAAGVCFVGAVAGPAALAQETNGLIHGFAPEDSGTVTRVLGARREIGKLLSSEKPQIVTSHFGLYAFPLLDRLREQPFIVHFHGPWADESKEEGAAGASAWVMRFIERTVYSRGDRLIVLSAAFQQYLSRHYNVDERKIRVVPGAVDLDRFGSSLSRLAVRKELDWPQDRPILLAVRRLVRRMGLQQLVEAMVEIRRHTPEVLLYLGGSGPLRGALEAQVAALGLGEHVRFTGFIPDAHLPLAYRAADLTVVPTASLEGFGLVAAESLAAGTPAMVTPVGGLPEVVAGLASDLILRSGAATDLADALTAALQGRIRLPSAEVCRSYAEQHFSRDLMARRTADVYRETLA